MIMASLDRVVFTSASSVKRMKAKFLNFSVLSGEATNILKSGQESDA